MPYKINQDRHHKFPKARYRLKNWRDYDAALCRWGDLTVWVTPAAMAAWTPPGNDRRRRPQKYSEIAVETGLMLRLAFGRAWRQTEGMLASIMRLLGLDLPAPDHTTFARRSADLTVARAVSVARGPVNVVIDSTGLKVFGAGDWQREKHGGKGRRTWRKLHLAVDPDAGEIVASELTSTEDGDASQVGPLLDQISGPIASATADGAYDGAPVYRTIAERDPAAEVIISPRSTAVPSDTAAVHPEAESRIGEPVQSRCRKGIAKLKF
ncbi:IS5 family transposase [Microvirga sp. BT688]|nr:IS5 family transposase [Microvirga sp.]MBD2750771.1 IS5 family transposase [Microvirga sp.]